MKKFYFLSAFLMFTLFLSAQTSVTFAVDMNGVAEFDPAIDVMKIGGDFQGWSPDDTVMEDADGNGVYAVTVDVSASDVLFKFVINAWETNEFHPDTPGTPGDCTVDDGAGNINRSEAIPADPTYSLPVYIYNTCEVSTLPVNVGEISTIQDVTIAPNPATDRALVTYANPNNANHDILVTSMTGQIVKQYNNISGSNLEINTAELATGMYFITFRNELGEQGSEKLVVQ